MTIIIIIVMMNAYSNLMNAFSFARRYCGTYVSINVLMASFHANAAVNVSEAVMIVGTRSLNSVVKPIFMKTIYL